MNDLNGGGEAIIMFSSYQSAVVVIIGLVLVVGGLARADDRPGARPLTSAGCADEQLAIGAPGAADSVAALVTHATTIPSSAGQPLLPPGTTVDRVFWAGNVVHIDLTIPADAPRSENTPAGWFLTDTGLETLSDKLAAPFAHDPAFGGVWVRARVGEDQSYSSLEPFTFSRPQPPQSVTIPPEVPTPITPEDLEAARNAPAPRGQYGNAARQPVGALTGVVVYTSAGHGWTAGDTSWVLQREILQGMNEDHGNIDQLNYFVGYAFNAGATVVPFRPVGWQPIEIVLDVNSPGVTYTGSWTDGTSTKFYGSGYKWTSASATETATARFTPTLSTTDFYPVFCFTPPGTNRVLQTYRISHNGGVSEVAIDHRLVGNGWVWLGNYYFVTGEDNWVEITNRATETGAIVADAIRWGDGVGDIVRPGPNSVSGYTRDEECSRYWANSELGNHATGFDSYIWDIPGSSDTDDNVRTAAKWSREMNQEPAGGVLVDRWKRIYLEFHTNATDGVARGEMCLITTLGATAYQTQYATILSNEVDADMLIMDDAFEHPWYDRTYPTYTSAYGAICTEANGDEFDATIVELAFHDQQDDAELLRDDRVRAAMAKSCVQGITRFLHTLPDSQIPLAFAPDTPRSVRVEDTGDGNVVVSWQAPLSDAARGDPATGYVVYQSDNGYGFGNPIVLGNVLTTTITDVAAGELRYFRVAATNAGGESMPSEVIAVRRPTVGTAQVLVVDGFHRLRRQLNPVETFTQPPIYAGQSIERQIWRRSNSFDYIVQHAEALVANDVGFASCANDAVINSYINLGAYSRVIWILGTQSVEDVTFTSTEQTKVSAYLNAGGRLFVSGADIGYDLVNQSHGASFAQDTLKFGYSANSAGTYQATGAANSIFAGFGPIDFSIAAGAPYKVASADVLLARTGSRACLTYVGGVGGVAGVQYRGVVYSVVSFGIPFETIGTPALRAQVMQKVLNFLALPPLSPFDYDRDGDVDWTDFGAFRFCFQGPGHTFPAGHACLGEDGDGDADIDLSDFGALQAAFTGPQ